MLALTRTECRRLMDCMENMSRNILKNNWKTAFQGKLSQHLREQRICPKKLLVHRPHIHKREKLVKKNSPVSVRAI